VPKDATSFLDGACPIVGSFGGKDRTLRGAAAKLDSALTANGVAHDVMEYPEATHGFLNDHQADEVPKIFVVLAKLMGGADYDEESAKHARKRITGFFDEHLKAGARDGN
jgi:carboxymethylenebutenolidase